MTVLINASNSSGLTITSDTSGNIAFQSQGTTVATISGTGANAGIQMGAAFAPAFSAYQSSGQALSSNTQTKLQFQAKEFDTANCFDNVTNYRFTPTVAGYYQVSGGLAVASSATQIQLQVYKNGSAY